jgi:8-oxo-dGTP diphosphatase
MKKRAVAVIIRDGEVLLMHRIKDGRDYFVFPGGGVEKDESVESAVVREMKEELNLDIKIDKLLFQIENQEREEFYFLVKEFSGDIQISGEEKERMNVNNQYHPTWFNLMEITELPNLYPEEAKHKINKVEL